MHSHSHLPGLCLGSLLIAPALLAQEQPPPAESRKQALERALRDLEADTPATTSQALNVPAVSTSPSQIRLLDLSLNILSAVGTSTERDAVLQDLQGGGHDPNRRGFTLQQAELAIGGAVDPFVAAQANITTFIDTEGETVVEVEEAFLQSLQFVADLQLKAGMYFTEFGIRNPTHAHAWDWQDQPIVITRLFGADGMRAPGARVAWLLPTETYTELIVGVQNAIGETVPSFLANEEVYEERGIGGRAFAQRDVRSLRDVLWSARLHSGFDVGASSSAAFGASVAYGGNATGEGVDTLIYGADFVFKDRPASGRRGWPFFEVDGEVMVRDFEAAAQVDDADPLNPVDVPGATLRDWGGYVQALYGFSAGWSVGARAEWVSGSGASYDAATQSFARANDPYRADRLRLSPLLVFQPSEFARFRLQYNYDDTDAVADPVHSVWLGFDVLLGTHPPHKY